MHTELDHFIAELERQETALKTVANYQSDLLCFGRWFEGSVGEAFSATAVTPTDVREYKSYLMTVEKRKPATVNRRLAALRKFFVWARAAKRISEDPTEGIKGIQTPEKAPRSLTKRDVDRGFVFAQGD